MVTELTASLTLEGVIVVVLLFSVMTFITALAVNFRHCLTVYVRLRDCGMSPVSFASRKWRFIRLQQSLKIAVLTSSVTKEKEDGDFIEQVIVYMVPVL